MTDLDFALARHIEAIAAGHGATPVPAGDAWLPRPGCAAAAAPLMPALHTAGARRYSSTFMSLRSSDRICRPDRRPWAGPRNSRWFSPNVSADSVLCCSSHPGAEPRPGKPSARVRARRLAGGSTRCNVVAPTPIAAESGSSQRLAWPGPRNSPWRAALPGRFRSRGQTASPPPPASASHRRAGRIEVPNRSRGCAGA